MSTKESVLLQVCKVSQLYKEHILASKAVANTDTKVNDDYSNTDFQCDINYSSELLWPNYNQCS